MLADHLYTLPEQWEATPNIAEVLELHLLIQGVFIFYT
jgi:hypothetical protein